MSKNPDINYIIDQIRSSIRGGKFEIAYSISKGLIRYTKGYQKDFDNLFKKIHAINFEENHGLVTFEQVNATKNKINYDLLLLLNKIEDNPVEKLTIGKIIRQQSSEKIHTLLNKVESDWIEEVLHKTFYGLHSLPIRKIFLKQQSPHAEEIPFQIPTVFSDEKSVTEDITDLFVKAEGRLIILGRPGSGKTIALLRLAEYLVQLSTQEASEPIPVVLKLSSWNRRASIKDWIIREVKSHYLIGEAYTKDWIANKRLIFLLDGLDEIPDEQRDYFAAALENFLAESDPSGLVITCRQAVYEKLSEKPKIANSLTLLPLDQEQLKKIIPELALSDQKLRNKFEKDQELLKLSASPLMLSLIVMAYRLNDQRLDFTEPISNNSSKRQQVFDGFFSKIIQKQKKSIAFSKEKLYTWTGWLAKNLLDKNKSIFLIEDLQYDWMDKKLHRSIYFWLVCIFYGGLAGVLHRINWEFIQPTFKSQEQATATETGSVWHWIVLSIVWTVAISISSKMFYEKLVIAKNRSEWYSRIGKILILVFWWFFLGSILYVLLPSADAVNDNGLNFKHGFIALSGFATILPTLVIMNRIPSILSIRPVELLAYDWKQGLKWGLIMVPVGIICGYYISLENFLAGSILFGIPLSVLGMIYGGFTPSNIIEKTEPNEGIKISLKNAIRISALVAGIALCGALFSVFIYKFTDHYQQNLDRFPSWIDYGIVIISGLTIVTFLVFGGFDVIKHFILRKLLVVFGYLPKDLKLFLKNTQPLFILQKVGGGFKFNHRFFMEYFAKKYNQSESVEDAVE